MMYYEKQIKKWGDSYLIPLPMKLVKELKLKVNDKITIKQDGTSLLIEKVKNSYDKHDKQ